LRKYFEMKSILNKIFYFLSLLLAVMLFLPFVSRQFYLLQVGNLWHLRIFYVFFLSFFISYVLVPICIYLGHRLKILDYPGENRIHKVPTPRTGGLAVFVAFLVVVLRNFKFSTELVGILLASSMMFILGFLDDIFSLPATGRLVIQIICGVVLCIFGVRLSFVPHIYGEEIVESILTVLWCILISNAYNFLDGMDGLVSGVAVINCIFFGIIMWQLRQEFTAYVAGSLGGSCLGFLCYNFPPARVFLGDSGSTFVGFILASIAVSGSWAENNPLVALSVPLIILGISVFDIIYTSIARLYTKRVRNILELLPYRGKDHIHHRLSNIGFSNKQVLSFVCLVSLFLGLLAIIMRESQKGFVALISLLAVIVFFLIIMFLMLVGAKRKN